MTERLVVVEIMHPQEGIEVGHSIIPYVITIYVDFLRLSLSAYYHDICVDDRQQSDIYILKQHLLSGYVNGCEKLLPYIAIRFGGTKRRQCIMHQYLEFIHQSHKHMCLLC